MNRSDSSGNTSADWEIELLRGLAACAVMLSHYLHFFTPQIGLLSFTYSGVDLFFVLSGFVFAPYLVRHRPIVVLPHLARRFFRLYPLYFVALGCYAALRLHDGIDWNIVFRHALFMHTTSNRAEAVYLNPAFWSLPPEIEFYLLLPAFAWLCSKRNGFFWLLGLAAGVRVLLTLVEPNVSISAPHLPLATMLHFHLPGLLPEFLCGALAYQLSHRLAARPRSIALLTIGLGLTILLAWGRFVTGILAVGGDAALETSPLTRHNVGIVAAIGYALLTAGFCGLRLRSRSLAGFAMGAGGLSYGVYLFHNLAPWLVEQSIGRQSPSWAIGILASLVTFACAAVLHRYYENPLRIFGRRFAQRISGHNRNTLIA